MEKIRRLPGERAGMNGGLFFED
jgi:hypothetical protein